MGMYSDEMTILVPLTRSYGAKLWLDVGSIEAIEEWLSGAVGDGQNRRALGSIVHTPHNQYQVKESPGQVISMLQQLINDVRAWEPEHFVAGAQS